MKTDDKILQSYLYTALWAETDDNEEPLDYNYDLDDFAEEAVSQAECDIVSFLGLAEGLMDGCDDTRVAHDFWLTRNHHGAGFWDGDYENGDTLTEICQSNFNTLHPYVGDDDKIYFL